MRGGSFALVESFKTGEFWQTIRRFGVTNTILLGAMTPFLLAAPPSASDRDHPLTRVTMVPLTEQHGEFAERFGVEVYTAFNMTEISSPLFAGPSPGKAGACGRPATSCTCMRTAAPPPRTRSCAISRRPAAPRPRFNSI